MFSQIHFQDSMKTTLKPAAFGFLSTTTLLTTLHFCNEIKNIGQLQGLYIAVLLLTFNVLQYVTFNGLPTLDKQTKWTVLKALILTLISIAKFFILAILFGAKAFSEHEETFMFSVYLTLCTTVHCIINMGVKDFNTMLTKQSNTYDIVLNSSQVVAMSSFFGCWSSAVVIPLDWERWWQKWPIPCVMGTLFGYSIGFLVTIVLAYMCDKSNLQKKKRHV